MKIINVVVAILFFFNAASDAATSSTDVAPIAPAGQKWVCSSSTWASTYTTSTWDCTSMKDAVSCNTGDYVLGLYSYYQTWPPSWRCQWRCANAAPVCSWQNANGT